MPKKLLTVRELRERLEFLDENLIVYEYEGQETGIVVRDAFKQVDFIPAPEYLEKKS